MNETQGRVFILASLSLCDLARSFRFHYFWNWKEKLKMRKVRRLKIKWPN